MSVELDEMEEVEVSTSIMPDEVEDGEAAEAIAAAVAAAAAPTCVDPAPGVRGRWWNILSTPGLVRADDRARGEARKLVHCAPFLVRFESVGIDVLKGVVSDPEGVLPSAAAVAEAPAVEFLPFPFGTGIVVAPVPAL